MAPMSEVIGLSEVPGTYSLDAAYGLSNRQVELMQAERESNSPVPPSSTSPATAAASESMPGENEYWRQVAAGEEVGPLCPKESPNEKPDQNSAVALTDSLKPGVRRFSADGDD